jgi:hypothetical protein
MSRLAGWKSPLKSGLGTTLLGNLMVASRPLATPSARAERAEVLLNSSSVIIINRIDAVVSDDGVGLATGEPSPTMTGRVLPCSRERQRS